MSKQLGCRRRRARRHSIPQGIRALECCESSKVAVSSVDDAAIGDGQGGDLCITNEVAAGRSSVLQELQDFNDVIFVGLQDLGDSTL